MNYRTETKFCIDCGLKVHYRLQVSEPKWKGNMGLQAISARECPRCITIAQLAEAGDELCQQTVTKRGGTCV
jgi:hypothetical protein